MTSSSHLNFLPANILSLSGYDFFQFIKNTLGEPEANLLAKISVKTTTSLILIDNPLDIFNHDVDDDELGRLKEQLCFKMKNDRFIIKPGVTAGFRSLREAIQEKLNQRSKQSNKKTVQPNINPSVISLAVLTSPKAVSSGSMSLFDHEQHVVRLIRKWCDENKEKFNLEAIDLREGIDFNLNLGFDENSIISGSIKCKCGKSILLARNEDKIQASNYYKHLQSTSCTLIKALKNSNDDLDESSQQHISTSRSDVIQPQETLDDEPMSTPNSPRQSLAASSRTVHQRKRRIESRPQHHPTTKRRRK